MRWADDQVVEYAVAGSTTVPYGSAVLINASGYAAPATSGASGQKLVGVAVQQVENTGANGARTVTVLRRGVITATIAGGITQTNVGSLVYLAGYDPANYRPTVHGDGTNRTAIGVLVSIDGTTARVRLGVQ